MKYLKYFLIVLLPILWSCNQENPLESDLSNNSLNTEDPVSLTKATEKLTPITDINFVDPRFRAYVFYDNIEGPDGIAVITNRRLLVVKEWGDPGAGVYRAIKGDNLSIDDAFSTLGAPFVGPDDILNYRLKGVFVADGQAEAVFRIPRRGGAPVPFVTTTTTGSPSFNPFGLAIAPRSFDGPNVDPGDIIVADNAYSSEERAVWAVNPQTGVAKIIAQGTVFVDGPLTPAFNSDGTLFIFENHYNVGSSRIVTLSADGTVTPFLTGIESIGSMAIHPKNDNIYFKKIEGEIWKISKTGGTPELFASNIGNYQDMAFNKAGNRLFVSVRARNQVVQISAKKKAW